MQMLIASVHERQFLECLCLPTAPTLLIGGNGDFGTSPFFGQRSDKLCLPRIQ